LNELPGRRRRERIERVAWWMEESDNRTNVVWRKIKSEN